ncbi:hypothetical protein IE53DRAFT_224430 [Violaceomyces palustris]|uniref:Uncharacterized protein n=1 Tax=Violaceomyces palustris TaxID=1673888 RepID=A0ACD0NQ22_9BASI|nr:hypothetical protein IE53DRAFT_224430 [Violaceomyces palustris]
MLHPLRAREGPLRPLAPPSREEEEEKRRIGLEAWRRGSASSLMDWDSFSFLPPFPLLSILAPLLGLSFPYDPPSPRCHCRESTRRGQTQLKVPLCNVVKIGSLSRRLTIERKTQRSMSGN